jgi:uncharacterized membrane-anchored protein
MIEKFHDHPLRETLANEVHARPFIIISAPQSISHFAMTREAGGDRDHLMALCARLGNKSTVGGNYALLDFGTFSLRWESHTEFSTWTFFAPAPKADPFTHSCFDRVPPDWLAGLPGLRIAAINVALESSDRRRAPADIEHLFMANSLAGSTVSGGAAEVWTDFRIHADGLGRILIQDRDLRPRQAGRLVQRMLEIETYRMMALLGLPVAQSASPKMLLVDRELAEIMPSIQKVTGTADEHALLERLLSLGTEIERITVDCDFRFGATKAYYALVERRIEELREVRLEGLQTLEEFVERRLAPAMRTCTSVSERLRTIAERLARCSDLLRTRVDIARETQNQQLLNSMDRRARVQLGLQATVEGLSIAAISYYAIGLIKYFAEGLHEAGAPFNMTLAMGFATPAICLAVWYIVRQIRRRIIKQADTAV